MLGKIDDLIQRFVEVFLYPLVNLMVVILIVLIATNPAVLGSVSFDAALSVYLETVSAFVKANFAAISKIMSSIKDGLPAISSIIAAVVLFVFAMIVYLADRLFAGVGQFLPPSFRFDLDAYEKNAGEKGRVEALAEIFGEAARLAKVYEPICAYLSAKNADQQRLKHRERLVSGIARAKKVATYVKAYICFLVLIIAFAALGDGKVSVSGAILVFVVLACALALAVLYFSRMRSALVRFDLDSFIWENSYSPQLQFKSSVLATPDMPLPETALGRWLRDRLYLRWVWFDNEL